jgi:hypothetical protein
MSSLDYGTIKEWLLANVDAASIDTVAKNGIWGASISALVTKDDVLDFFEFYKEEISGVVEDIFYAMYEHRPQDWFSLAKRREYGNFNIVDIEQAKQFYVGLAVKDAALRIFQEREMIEDAQEREAAK